MIKIVLAALLAFPMLAFADSVVFGLELEKYGIELGEATLEDIKGKVYDSKGKRHKVIPKVTMLGINKYTKGRMYSLPVPKKPNDGHLKLITAYAVFSQGGTLVAVLLKLPASEYDRAFEMALNKFTIVPEPDKSNTFDSMFADQAKFIDGNTQVMLYRKHLGKEMEMNFVQKDVWQSFKEEQKKQLEARD